MSEEMKTARETETQASMSRLNTSIEEAGVVFSSVAKRINLVLRNEPESEVAERTPSPSYSSPLAEQIGVSTNKVNDLILEMQRIISKIEL